MQNNGKIGIPSEKPRRLIDRRLSVAPMMDWTDSHCRYVHRLFSPHALLYTEMIVSTALVRGDARRFLEHSPAEHPLALQLGGCDPKELAVAALPVRGGRAPGGGAGDAVFGASHTQSGDCRVNA